MTRRASFRTIIERGGDGGIRDGVYAPDHLIASAINAVELLTMNNIKPG